MTHTNLPANTTREQDLRTQAQRELNMTWEITQSVISKVVVATTCCGMLISLSVRAFYPERLIAFPSEWWAIVGLVIGFYFGRTNHARISGVAGPANKADHHHSLDDRVTEE